MEDLSLSPNVMVSLEIVLLELFAVLLYVVLFKHPPNCFKFPLLDEFFNVKSHDLHISVGHQIFSIGDGLLIGPYKYL